MENNKESMAEQKLDRARIYFHCSSSIANFQEKLDKRLGIPRWNFLQSLGKTALFMGMYTAKDYFLLSVHRGKKKIFWCGADILNLKKRKLWQLLLRILNPKHYCENIIEQRALRSMGFFSEILPMIFDDPNKFSICFQHSEKPRLFLTTHHGRDNEYGLGKIGEISALFPDIEFIAYDGVPEEVFNEEIKRFTGAIRLNRFDGFAETLAKSVLMGQYPISTISYPHITYVPDGKSLATALANLRKKKKPNYEAAAYWREKFKESLYELLKP